MVDSMVMLLVAKRVKYSAGLMVIQSVESMGKRSVDWMRINLVDLWGPYKLKLYSR